MITDFSGKYDFLSNFYRHPFMYIGQEAPTAEHHFQALKAQSEEDYLWVLSAPTPSSAKRRGRSLDRRPDWDDIKVGVMKDILTFKFTIPELRERLLQTGDEILVEGNTWGDTFWGQCPVGEGQNWLGKALMEIRNEIR